MRIRRPKKEMLLVPAQTLLLLLILLSAGVFFMRSRSGETGEDDGGAFPITEVAESETEETETVPETIAYETLPQTEETETVYETTIPAETAGSTVTVPGEKVSELMAEVAVPAPATEEASLEGGTEPESTQESAGALDEGTAAAKEQSSKKKSSAKKRSSKKKSSAKKAERAAKKETSPKAASKSAKKSTRKKAQQKEGKLKDE